MDEGSDSASKDAQQALWIKQIAAGGAQANVALRHLSEAYDRNMLSRARWRFHLSFAEAEEALQETWISVWKGAASFRSGERPSPWIWTIFNRTAFNVLRDRARKMQAQGESDARTVEEIKDPRDPDAPPALAADLCVQRGFQAFAKAHPEDAEALALRDLERWEIKELAAYLGRTETATRTYLWAVRRKLKPYIAACLELLPRR